MFGLFRFRGWLTIASLLLLLAFYSATLAQSTVTSSAVVSVLDDERAKSGLVAVLGGDGPAEKVVNSPAVHEALISVQHGAQPATVSEAIMAEVGGQVGADSQALARLSALFFDRGATRGGFHPVRWAVKHSEPILAYGGVTVGLLLTVAIAVKGNQWWARGRYVARWALLMGLIPLGVIYLLLPAVAALANWGWASMLAVFLPSLCAGFVKVWVTLLGLAGALYVANSMQQALPLRSRPQVRSPEGVGPLVAEEFNHEGQALPNQVAPAQ